MKKNGYTVTEMLVVIVVLGVFMLVTVFSTSHAFEDRSQGYYKDTEHLIVKQAELYGETLDSLKKEGNLVITLNDLIEAGYYVADDSDGNVVDPRNSKATLNGLKIKLTYENETVTASIIEEE